jgi:hypothetical protein
MQAPSILGTEENLRHQAVLHGVRRPPLARHHRVVAKVPPEIIGEALRAALNLPAAEHVEALGVDEEDTAGRIVLGIAKRRDIDAVGPAMDRRLFGLGLVSMM